MLVGTQKALAIAVRNMDARRRVTAFEGAALGQTAVTRAPQLLADRLRLTLPTSPDSCRLPDSR